MKKPKKVMGRNGMLRDARRPRWSKGWRTRGPVAPVTVKFVDPADLPRRRDR